MKEKYNQLAKTFSYIFRYIDDLLAVNNLNFENETSNIYPELKKGLGRVDARATGLLMFGS